MECFRPVAFDVNALERLKRTDGATASFLIIADPSRNLTYGLRQTFADLAPLMVDVRKGQIRALITATATAKDRSVRNGNGKEVSAGNRLAISVGPSRCSQK